MKKITELKAVLQDYTNALATITRVLPEALPSGTWPGYQRESITAHLESANPGLAIRIASLCASGRGGEAIDALAAAVADLRATDAPLFEKTPTREECLKLAVKAFGGHHTDSMKASLWVSFCDRDDHHRFAAAYDFRHTILARGTAKPSPRSHEVLHEGAGRIDGGSAARARVEAALAQSNEDAATEEGVALDQSQEGAVAPITEGTAA